MSHMVIVRPDGSIVHAATEAEIAHAYRDDRELIWIDFDRTPTASELEFLSDLLDLGENAVEHLSRPHRGPRASRFQAYILAVLYDVTLLEGTPDIETREVVLLFSDRFLISVHDGPSQQLAQVTEQLDRVAAALWRRDRGHRFRTAGNRRQSLFADRG